MGPFKARSQPLLEPDMNHSAVLRSENILYIAWTKLNNDQIMLSQVDTSSDNWDNWKATKGIKLVD